MKMTFLRYLEKVRGLLKKGYKVHNSTESTIELDTPGGDILTPLQAVFLEETGDQLDVEEFDAAMRRISMDPELADRISEAEEESLTRSPRLREAIWEALGIKTIPAA